MRTWSTPSEETFYLAGARAVPELDREQEAQLVERWQHAGDRNAANVVARAYQRQVVALAMKYRRYGVPVGELIAEGNVGVVKALGKFEPARGVRFGTYASHWVRAQMLAHVVKARSTVSGSDGPLRTQVFFRLRRERARVLNLLGPGEAADRELAQRLGVSSERLKSLLQRLDSRDVSLDAESSSEIGTLVDRLPSGDDQEQAYLAREAELPLQQALGAAVARLDRRERQIVQQHVMAEGDEQRSLAEIARELGISRERARQLETRALRKLRHALEPITSTRLQ